ncbi:movement protein [Heracleum sosnowskyi]|uniref:Movement protein n=1 Tax=Heracleum sosnowskyi TaxID=360622 RepID=A0AAD8N3N9_9APIA|nr:movement protein [Heracleum sosnowskyi]
MDVGDKVFNISYVVAYALTNSHHSIDYKKSEYIELEDVFSNIGSIEEKEFSELSLLENSWAIDIARNKPHLGEKPRMSFKGRKLVIGESSTDNLLRNVSTRIDNLSQKLELIS